jgi:RHS repeat-associated protein
LVLDRSGNVKNRYLNGPNENQVLAEETNISGNGAGTTRWALTDHEGSVRDVVGNTGVVLDHIQYDSFGNVLSQTNSANAMRLGYTGQQFDAETGLYYDHARYYDPASGRFLSTDPSGFSAGDANLYRYVGNSPLNNTDPTGLCADSSTGDTSDNQVPSATADQRQAAQDASALMQKVHAGQYGTDDLRQLRADLLQIGAPADATNQYINELANAAVSRNSAAAQQNIDANSGIHGFFNNVQQYYAGAGQTLIDNANHSQSTAAAAVEGAVGQYLQTFGGMLNIPAQRDARIAAQQIYQDNYGLNSTEAWFLSSAYYTPVLRSFVGAYEMGQGQSIGAFDVGRPLTGQDYLQRTLTIAQDVGTVASFDGAFSGTPKSGETNAPVNQVPQDPFPGGEYQGTEKPWTDEATPNSKYTQVDANGRAVQNAIYDANGDVIGHVDFKNHGAGAPSGHGHEFPEPGNPASGHGPGAPHIPNDQLPPGWDGLPPGVQPKVPIGS